MYFRGGGWYLVNQTTVWLKATCVTHCFIILRGATTDFFIFNTLSVVGACANWFTNGFLFFYNLIGSGLPLNVSCYEPVMEVSTKATESWLMSPLPNVRQHLVYKVEMDTPLILRGVIKPTIHIQRAHVLESPRERRRRKSAAMNRPSEGNKCLALWHFSSALKAPLLQ